ncbi:hypothetical protein MKZ38_000089 [Zalerion maritima]|uniref:Uncharacterized protein n=1 Tax=Zalerion maritima TaxID=339359 RepID=A0AAD5RRW8_9PEZI|nr:hypothetical protein MKZ38_000089 [Zalerion maritima]
MNQGTIMRRLLGQRSNVDPSNEANLGATSSPIAASYRPSASQTVVYNAGVPITCLDASPDGRSAILAGRHVLKIVALDGLNMRELTDLRSLITAQPIPRPNSTLSVSDQLSIRDAKWASAQAGRPTILTACASGRIYQYDLGRLGTVGPGSGLNSIQTREDSRQINTLDVSPHRDTYLLSGSQDGVVRFFDLRTPTQTSTGLTFKSTRAFKCHADPVRQVKWSIRDGFFFACATEQGVIIKWDSRKNNAPVLRITGHERPCASISWHPDGDHLVSGGWDNKCYVWDLSKNNRRQKPKHTISTPAPVSVVEWRPGLWSATAQGKRAAQIAVSYDNSSQKRFGINSVHIWDLARPAMPFKEIDRFDASPSGMLWHNHDLLWTAGQDGLFAQCDVAFAPRVIDRHSLTSATFSHRGDIVMVLDEKAPPQRPRHSLPIIAPEKHIPSSYNASPTGPMLSISRSDSEDDVVGSFLGPRRRSHRPRRERTRSSHQLSTTPPSVPGTSEPVLSLDQGIKAAGVYKSQQVLSTGHLPGANNMNVYQYLAATYMETLENGLPYRDDGRNLMTRVLNIMEVYARAAASVGQFRLAQTWRVLAYAITLLLEARVQYHLETRQHHFQKKKKAMEQMHRHGGSLNISSSGLLQGRRDVGEETPKNTGSANGADRLSLQSHRSLLSEEIDSTSTVTTPLARPVSDDNETTPSPPPQEYVPGKKLTPVLEAEPISLPPAVSSEHAYHEVRRRLDSVPLSVVSHDSEVSQVSSTEGYDFYDTEALRKAIDVPPRSHKSERHPRDFVAPGSPQHLRRPLLRNDSTDSYGQMFSISDGSRRTTGLTASSDGSPSNTRIAPSHTASSDTLFGDNGLRRSDLSILSRPSPNRSESSNSKDFPVASQTTTDSFPSHSYELPSFSEGPPPPLPPTNRSPDLAAFLGADDDTNLTTVRETDYLPWPGDPPYPFANASETPDRKPSPPLEPYTLIARALSFETQFSAVNAAAIILLLKPLLPSAVIDSSRATAILRQFHVALMGMRLFIEAALLRNLCVDGWSGIEHWGNPYPTIFGSAQQGIKAAFMCSSCYKPRDINHAPDSGDPGVWICTRCRSVNGPCAVCGHREAAADILPPAPLAMAAGRDLPCGGIPSIPAEEPVLSTWWYCPTCGHGGHSTCLQGWHGVVLGGPSQPNLPGNGIGREFSDGCCPLDGCGHACLPGKWRSESSMGRTEELGRKVSALERNRVLGIIAGDNSSNGTSTPVRGGRGSLDGGPGLGMDRLRIRGDWNDVPQSKAVESVRESFVRENLGHGHGGGYGFGNSSSPGSGILSSSPGRGGDGGRERRKSVKFAGDGPR